MKFILMTVLAGIVQFNAYGAESGGVDISPKPITADQKTSLALAKEAAENAIRNSKNRHCKAVAQAVLSGSGYAGAIPESISDIDANRRMMAYRRAFVSANSDNTTPWDRDANIDSDDYRKGGMWKPSEALFDRIFVSTQQASEDLPAALKEGAVKKIGRVWKRNECVNGMGAKTRMLAFKKRDANFSNTDLRQFPIFGSSRRSLASNLVSVRDEYDGTGNLDRTAYKKAIEGDTAKLVLLRKHDEFVDALRSLDPSVDIISKMQNILKLKKIYDDLPPLQEVRAIREDHKRKVDAGTENDDPNKKPRTEEK